MMDKWQDHERLDDFMTAVRCTPQELEAAQRIGAELDKLSVGHRPAVMLEAIAAWIMLLMGSLLLKGADPERTERGPCGGRATACLDHRTWTRKKARYQG